MASTLYVVDNTEPVDLASPLKYGGDIKNKKVGLEYFLHDFVVDKDDYYIFLGLLNIIFNDIKSVADDFDNLADVNNVYNAFLPKLSYLMNYTFHYDLPDDINRDIIKRLLYIYKQKARDKEVLEAADWANNINWIASTLFVPTPDSPIPVPDDRTSKLYYPITMLFTHSVSKHDGGHRYSDETRWRDGVIVIQAENINPTVRTAIKRVLPAGLKAYYEALAEMKAEDGEESGYGKSLKYPEWTLLTMPIIDYFLRLESNIQSDRWSQDSVNYQKVFSGKLELYPHYELDRFYASSMLPLYGERVYDIFEFLKTLEKSLPSRISYDTSDESINKSLEIVNITKDINNDNDNLESASTKRLNTFNRTTFSGRFIFNQTIDDIANDTVPSTTNIDESENSNTNNENKDDDYLSEDEKDKLELASTVLKNPTQTELLTFYKDILLKQYLKIFSLYTENPIHDIDYPVQPVEVTKKYKGFPRYSKAGTFSGKKAWSGQANTLYIQAKYEHILAWDDHYPVSDVLDRVPAQDNYQSGTMDSLGLPDEALKIDIHIYKNMEYRGLIDADYFNQESNLFTYSLLEDTTALYDKRVTNKDIYLSDLVSDDRTIADTYLRDNMQDTIFYRKLEDFVIIELSEVVKLEEIKMKDIYQVDRNTKTRVRELKLEAPSGLIRYIVYHNLDRYLDEHLEKDVDVTYETDYGSRPIEVSYLNERLITDDIVGKEYKNLYNIYLNDFCYGLLVKELLLLDEVRTFNRIYELPLYKSTLNNILYPNRHHNNKTIAEEGIEVRHKGIFLYSRTLQDNVKLLEAF